METPISKLSGGLVTINCSLSRMLFQYLHKNFQSSSRLILFSASGWTKFKMMLLKISEYCSCSSHLTVFAACSSLTKFHLEKSYKSDKSDKIPALKTVAPIEKIQDFALAELSNSFSPADLKSSGASNTFFEGLSTSVALIQLVFQYGKE